MAINAAHWTVTRSNGNIRYIGDDHGGASPSYATVIEFHRWLQGLADDAVATGDDELDITNVDPSRRSTDNIITLINGYNITDAEAEHLYDGSIIQDGGNTIYDGIVNFGNADVQIQIMQDGAVLADDWWNYSGAGLNASATAGISHRFMIKTRTGGVDIDGRRLIGTARRFGYTYSEFSINGTSRGNNVLALSDSTDLNNATGSGTLDTWDQFYNDSTGYVGIDVNNDTVNEYYYSSWSNGSGTLPATPDINDFYEYCKYITRDGTSSTLYGLSGELFRGITHEVVVDTPTGTFNNYEGLNWATGSGQMLAVDSTTTPTKLWLQLLNGVAPVDNQTLTGVTSAATCDVNVTVTDRSSTISKPFCGASTGSALIGAYGVGIDTGDLSASDKLTDLAASVITPPNYVTNTVAGLTSGEDRVLVGPWDGSTYDSNGDPSITKTQLSLSTGLTADNITSVVVVEAIPADTPLSGYIRVIDDSGFERRLHYSSWSTSTFTIDTTDGNEDFATTNATSGNDVYIAYIDELASGTTATFTGVQSGSRQLVVIVRDGAVTPIKQFISSWSYTSSNQTISAIRTTDE